MEGKIILYITMMCSLWVEGELVPQERKFKSPGILFMRDGNVD